MNARKLEQTEEEIAKGIEERYKERLRSEEEKRRHNLRQQLMSSETKQKEETQPPWIKKLEIEAERQKMERQRKERNEKKWTFACGAKVTESNLSPEEIWAANLAVRGEQRISKEKKEQERRDHNAQKQAQKRNREILEEKYGHNLTPEEEKLWRIDERQFTAHERKEQRRNQEAREEKARRDAEALHTCIFRTLIYHANQESL